MILTLDSRGLEWDQLVAFSQTDAPFAAIHLWTRPGPTDSPVYSILAGRAPSGTAKARRDERFRGISSALDETVGENTEGTRDAACRGEA